ncbi:hypothetical protein [Rhizobium herbae]|uniref:Uncharacterized protein n=1 Tax=Rhizobium herbae TaxID=508661 RepID=A0ABS4EMF7_9HYPH|nr:hypothetical protein [Rhizobium herbae]MBP1859138.1 hypothetical protein [Rhizobium herbae]
MIVRFNMVFTPVQAGRLEMLAAYSVSSFCNGARQMSDRFRHQRVEDDTITVRMDDGSVCRERPARKNPLRWQRVRFRPVTYVGFFRRRQP